MAKLLNHDDHTVAWIAVLPIEAQAALRVLDELHDGSFPSMRGEDYLYIPGQIGTHNVIVATLPEGQNYGVGAAAALASQIKICFCNIRFALLVGVAAGTPTLGRHEKASRQDIRLGDVLVCVPDRESTGVVQYDLGRHTENGFLLTGRSAEIPTIVRAAIGQIRSVNRRPFKAGTELAVKLSTLLQDDEEFLFARPPQNTDQLFKSSQEKSQSGPFWAREPRDEAELVRVWYGRIGSGSTVVKSSQRRDELRDRHNLIGLEMEAAGVTNVFPTGIVRGVCDYADDQKTKLWQPHAAATAAVYAKAIICIIPTEMAPKGSDIDLSVEQKILIPYKRDKYFVDRPDLMDHVHVECAEPGGRIALLGPGGVGKSQIAIEYAFRVHETKTRDWTFWLNASTITRFKQDYHSIAETIQLPGRQRTNTDIIYLVNNWLRHECNGSWILIIDNADDAELFRGKFVSEGGQTISLLDALPRNRHGSVLLTTRSRIVALDLVEQPRYIVSVGLMSDKCALTLLRTKLDVWPTDAAGLHRASELVRELEYWPLAITQAAAFINRGRPRSSIAKYLTQFRRDRNDSLRLLRAETTDLRRDEHAPNSILSTWQISFNHIRATWPEAAKLLSLMSCCDRHAIPDFMLRSYFNHQSCLSLPSYAQNLTAEQQNLVDRNFWNTEENFDDSIAVLDSYCMISSSPDGKVFQIHALVQLAIQDWLEGFENLQQWKHAFVVALYRSVPDYDGQNEAAHRALLPHVELAERQSWSNEHANLLLAAVLREAGAYANGVGRPLASKRMLSKAASMQHETLGLEHLETLSTLHKLALTLFVMGKHREAVMNCREILGVVINMVGNEANSTLTIELNLARVLMELEQYEEAEKLLEHVVCTCRKQKERGTRYLDQMRLMSFLLCEQGEFKAAEELRREALQGYQRLIGDDDMRTMSAMQELVFSHINANRSEAAITLQRQILARYVKLFRPRHPLILKAKSFLAYCLILWNTGEEMDAEMLLQQVLAVQRTNFGPEHRYSLLSAEILAQCLLKLGRINDAEQLARDILRLCYKKPSVPSRFPLLKAISILARILECGEILVEEATDLYHQALELSQNTYSHEQHRKRLAMKKIAISRILELDVLPEHLGRPQDSRCPKMNKGREACRKARHALLILMRPVVRTPPAASMATIAFDAHQPSPKPASRPPGSLPVPGRRPPDIEPWIQPPDQPLPGGD